MNTLNYFAPLQQLLEQTINLGFMKPACRALYGLFSEPTALLDFLESDEAQAVDLRGMKNI